MSTVLTKPVLLDETGQAIVDKLEDIQLAIGGTGEFIPINIRVTTPPTKTNYLAGETLDLSGMVVTLVASNGGMYDVTGDCVFSPADGSVVTSSTTEVNISYTWYKDSTVFTAVQPIGMKELVSITVTSPPTQTEYYAGDELDLTGIVVTAAFRDGSTADVTEQCEYSPADGDILSPEDSTINISIEVGATTITTTQEITVTVPVYGVEWDGTATTSWVRTDLAENFTDPVPYVDGATEYASPFDDIMPWAGMIIEERTGGTCVKIPKFWYKLTQNGSGMKIQISSMEQDGYKVSPAHMDRGDGQGERDYVYVGRYKCGASSHKSTTGITPQVSTDIATFTSQIHGLGSNIWLNDLAMRFTIWLLYLVEFANWNSQEKIGYGGGNVYVETMGQTDAMPYHTGTIQQSRTTFGVGTQYRNIESLWDNGLEFIGGVRNFTSGMNIILNPSDFPSGAGVSVGNPASGYPTGFTVKNDIQGAFDIFIPSGSGGSTSTYSCDVWQFGTGTNDSIYKGGGDVSQNLNWGLFAFEKCGYSHTGSTVTARLMELPANT